MGRRYLARVIDSLAIGVIVTPALSALGAPILGNRDLMTILGSLLALVVIWIGYGTFLESSLWQATLGKRLMGLRVCDFDGGRLEPHQLRCGI